MPFLFWLISAFLLLRNPFSGKKYRAYRIHHAILVARQNPEIVLQDYSHYVERLLMQSLDRLDKRTVVFYECPGLHFWKAILPSRSILLQIEHTLLKPKDARGNSAVFSGQLPLANSSSVYLVRIHDFAKLQLADLVIDYSRINLWNVRSAMDLKAYFQKTICISPALYPLHLSTQKRAGVITLFGNTEVERRKCFLEDLKRHAVVSKNISGVYSGVEQIYQKAKVVINIRQTDVYDTLEELRVLPALRSGAIVICENAPFKEKTAYSQFIIWGSLEEIPQLVKDVEINYEVVHRRIFGDGSQNSAFNQRMARIERCNALAMQRALRKLHHRNYND
jgi:hypothetical protein